LLTVLSAKSDRGPPPQDDGAVNPGSNLFVTGIHPRLSEAEVTRLFEKYGEVEKCQIMVDPHTKESRGFGFVKMVTAEQADAAKEGLQGEVIEGRTLSIEKARRARPRTPTPGKYFGPPKRGNYTPHTQELTSLLTRKQTTLVDPLRDVTAIASTTDAVVAMAVMTLTATVAPAMTVTAPMAVTAAMMATPPAELTVTPVAMIVTAVEAMTAVAAVADTLTATTEVVTATVDAHLVMLLQLPPMATQLPVESPGSHMEVEPMMRDTPVVTIEC
jgi:hypothetical protein